MTDGSWLENSSFHTQPIGHLLPQCSTCEANIRLSAMSPALCLLEEIQESHSHRLGDPWWKDLESQS
jgi:hypothetical protein